MLCDIITDAVTHGSDLEVVGVLPDRTGMLAAVDHTHADVVVLRLQDTELPEECDVVFDTHPRIKVLGVSADGHGTFLYELRPYRSALGEVSPDEMLNAIRTALPREAP